MSRPLTNVAHSGLTRSAAEDRRARVAADPPGTLLRDGVGVGRHRPDGGGERVDEPPLRLVDGFLRELVEGEAGGVIRQSFRKRPGHRAHPE